MNLGRRIVKRLDGTPFDALPPKHHVRKKPVMVEAIEMHEGFTVETLEGVMTGNAGDFLITGVNGEHYPCKPDIFHKTYDFIDFCSALPREVEKT